MNYEKINSFLSKLYSHGKIFFYGPTAVNLYKDSPLSTVKILTDINITSISQYIPGIKFTGNFFYDCYTIIDDGTLITFYVDENEETDYYSYLINVIELNKINPLFLLFSPISNRFYSLREKSFDYIKKNIIHLDSLFEIKLEELLDIIELSCNDNSIIVLKNRNEKYTDTNEWKTNNHKLQVFLPCLEKILTSSCPYNGLIFLEKIGLLNFFFPFLDDLRGIEQDRCLHPEGDVFEHTIHCFQFIKNPSLRLAFGLLLHDYGKSIPTKQKGFRNHSFTGANKIVRILRPYGYSEEFINDVRFLVEYHMVNSYFFRINKNDRNKLFNNNLGADLLKLYKADTLGSIGKLDDYKEIISLLKKKSKVY